MTIREDVARELCRQALRADRGAYDKIEFDVGVLWPQFVPNANAVLALLPAQGWQEISTAPNDGDCRWYGLHVTHKSGNEWFEAHYISHDDDGQMRLPSCDNFDDWAFSDFEVWCDAPPPPVAIIAEERGT